MSVLCGACIVNLHYRLRPYSKYTASPTCISWSAQIILHVSLVLIIQSLQCAAEYRETVN